MARSECLRRESPRPNRKKDSYFLARGVCSPLQPEHRFPHTLKGTYRKKKERKKKWGEREKCEGPLRANEQLRSPWPRLDKNVCVCVERGKKGC